MTRRSAVIVILLAIVPAYGAGWWFRWGLGIVGPMANLRYFYYGAGPCTLSDSLLFWTYSPLYETWLGLQTWQGDRFEVHWSDREGGTGYEHLCARGRRLGV